MEKRNNGRRQSLVQGRETLAHYCVAARPALAAMAASQRTLLQSAKQLRQMAAAIRASTEASTEASTGASTGHKHAEVGCGRPQPALSSKRLPACRRSPSAGDRPGETVGNVAVGVLAVEVASVPDATEVTTWVALVSRCERSPMREPQWRQCTVGHWLVLQGTAGVRAELIVEVRSGSTNDFAATRGSESHPSQSKGPPGLLGHVGRQSGGRLGSLVVDCTAVCTGQGDIDSWFQISGTHGNAAARVLLAVEHHVPAAATRGVDSLPPGWEEAPPVDMAERVSEVAKRVYQRRRRHNRTTSAQQQASCTAAGCAAVQSDALATLLPSTGSAETSMKNCDNGRDHGEKDRMELKKAVLQNPHAQPFDSKRRARPGGNSRLHAARGPLKQQRQPRDPVKRAPDMSPATAVTAAAGPGHPAAAGPGRPAATLTLSTTPRRRRKREFSLLNALL